MPKADKALYGVTSPKEADGGAVGRVAVLTDVARTTDAAKVASAALADIGFAFEDLVTDEEIDIDVVFEDETRASPSMLGAHVSSPS
jgi:hypothetical protein